MYTKGNIKKLKLQNFKGVKKLDISFSQSINFLLAPNGHGKSSILQAISLCLGSSSSDLNGLLFEGCQQGYAQLEIQNSPQSHVIKVSVFNDLSRIYYIDGAKASLQTVQSLASSLNITIDNPFVSMMQHSAQKIMEVNAFERLQYITQLCNNQDGFKVDVSQILQQLDLFQPIQQQFISERNQYVKSAKDFKLYEELSLLKKIIYELEQYADMSKIEISLTEQGGLQVKYDEEQRSLANLQELLIHQTNELEELNRQLQLLDKEKSSQFFQYKRKYEYFLMKKNTLKSDLNDLKCLKQEEQNIKDMQKDQNYDQKQDLETQLNVIQNQKSKVSQDIDELQNKLIQLNNDNSFQDNQMLNSITEKFQQIKNLKIKCQTQLRAYQTNCKNSQWFQYCEQIQRENSQSFMIFPVLSHIAVNQISVIPLTDARLIMLFILGNDINTVIASSFEVNTLLSKQFHQFQNKGGATSVITLQKEYQNLSYIQAFNLAKQSLKQNNSKIILKSLKQHQIVCCLDLLIGNPLVCNLYQSRFKTIYYIKHDDNQSDSLVTKEIDFIFENNDNVTGIFFRNRFYKVLKYNGHYNGKQTTQINSQNYLTYNTYLQVSQEDQFKHEIIINEEYKKIETQYNEKQNQLANARELIEAKELQIKSIKQKMDNYKHLLIQLNEDIDTKKRQISSIRTVTQEEIQINLNKLQHTQQHISTSLLEINKISHQILTMQVDCSDIMIKWSSIENQIEKIKLDLSQNQHEARKLTQNSEDFKYKLELIQISITQQLENLKKYKISISNTNTFSKHFAKLKTEISQDTLKIIEETENLQNTLSQFKHRLQLKVSQQNVDITKLQDSVLTLYNQLVTIYNNISKEALILFNSFQNSINQLELFLQQLNSQFTKNLEKFAVSGCLKLKTWKSGAESTNNKELREQKILLEATIFQPISANSDPQEISKQLQLFHFDPQQLSSLLRRFSPGVDVETRFSSSEKLSAASLSGGERSVISLCLACCLRGIPARIIDEINQGMDEEFEKCAHEMVRSLSGQVIVSSPKVNSGMGFDGVKVIVISRCAVNE